MRHSRKRDMILKELRQLDTHPSAAELFDIVRERIPQISLGTVYRNLNQLAETGQILRLSGDGGQARFDGDIHPHHHVRCIHCGRVGDVHDVQINDPTDHVESPDGFEIIGCDIEFLAVCSNCSDRRDLDTDGGAL